MRLGARCDRAHIAQTDSLRNMRKPLPGVETDGQGGARRGQEGRTAMVGRLPRGLEGLPEGPGGPSEGSGVGEQALERVREACERSGGARERGCPASRLRPAPYERASRDLRRGIEGRRRVRQALGPPRAGWVEEQPWRPSMAKEQGIFGEGIEGECLW